jgi:hypothetical protein
MITPVKKSILAQLHWAVKRITGQVADFAAAN